MIMIWLLAEKTRSHKVRTTSQGGGWPGSGRRITGVSSVPRPARSFGVAPVEDVGIPLVGRVDDRAMDVHMLRSVRDMVDDIGHVLGA